MPSSKQLIEMEHQYGAHNYHPLDVVICKAKGIWVTDPEGKKYVDMLSAYSAVNQGHRHPEVIKTLKKQAGVLTLTSRAFHNDRWPLFAKKLAGITKKEMILPMNTGAEGVETAIKTMRKWGYKVKGIKANQAEIIVFAENFHGRTTTIVGFSTDPSANENYGPFCPGFKIVPYNDLEAVKKAITKNTCGILVEPIQGEAGIIVPDKGFLQGLEKLARQNNVLLACDEIQTGLGRTGKMFCFEHEKINPDIIILGKALGGGVLPVSAVAADKKVLGVFEPGTHGSTFGGNPLACAVAMTALDVLIKEKMVENSAKMGDYFLSQLEKFAKKSTKIEKVRGKGLLIGVVLKKEAGKARQYTTALKGLGLLCKETHDYIIRFAPPLVITKKDIDWAMKRIEKVLA